MKIAFLRVDPKGTTHNPAPLEDFAELLRQAGHSTSQLFVTSKPYPELVEAFAYLETRRFDATISTELSTLANLHPAHLAFLSDLPDQDLLEAEPVDQASLDAVSWFAVTSKNLRDQFVRNFGIDRVSLIDAKPVVEPLRATRQLLGALACALKTGAAR